MALYKRGGVWWIDFHYKGRRYREGVGTNKKLAETIFQKRKVEVVEGRYLDVKKEPKVRFEELAKEYLKYSQVNKRSHKRDGLSIKHLLTHFRGKLLTEVTSKMIEDYKATRARCVKGSTVNRELACLKHMFTMAIKWGKALSNPVKEVKFFREPKGSLRVLSHEEEEKLLLAASPHLQPIIVTALNTGMRRGEILSLTWDKVDFGGAVITVEHSKNGEMRQIPMNFSLTETLKRIKRVGGYVFCKPDGSVYGDIKTAFHAAVRRSGIAHVRFHDLRHTFASRLVMSGVDLVTVQQLLGHKSITTTMKYSHPTPMHKKWAVEVLSKETVTKSTTVPDKVNEAAFITY